MALIVPSQTRYLDWQQRLQSNKSYRHWWQFWSNYSFVFFIAAGTYLMFSQQSNGFGINEIIAALTASFLVSRLVITPAINFIYKRERPYQKYNLNLITSKFFSMRDVHHNSFPSRHSITYASVAGSFFVIMPALGVVLLFVTMITGVARVILGYHWPTDILGGLIVGSITGYFVTIFIGTTFFT